MAAKIIDINEDTIKKYVETLRPENLEMRTQIDIGYTFDGVTIILFEIRPSFFEPSEVNQIEFAKVRYYKTKQKWSLYWMTANEKWIPYKPFPESTNLASIIEVLKKDKNGCFFG